MVNVGTATAVRSVKESTPVSTVPFGPQRRLLSPHGPLLLHGANASGVETVARTPTSSVNNVNSVQFCRSFSPSHSLVPVPVNVVASSAQVTLASSQPQGVSAQTPLTSTCMVASTVRQDLVPPSGVTPINAQKLWCELRSHPDQVKVDYVITGLTTGFRLGFDPSAVSLTSAVHNMPSASLQPSVIDQYLLSELEKGRVAGPFPASPIPNLHISRFGVIPKKHQPGKWRLILDLSSPLGHSVNDGISKEPFSVQYMKVDDVICGIMSLGRGTLMAKFDVESAYRNVPVHPEDRYLLGMKWQGNYFIDMALPFGLRSAPFIFSSFADLLEWILKHNYGLNFLLHYLDDFYTLGPPNSPVCPAL